MNLVKSACNLCIRRCGIDAYVENNHIVKITGMQEHPFNTLCAKGYAIPELVHSKERLTQPLQKVNGRFREVSWDKALDHIAEKLTQVREKHGARSLIVHFGVSFNYSYIEYIARRFCDAYGTPNYTSGCSFCFHARVIGQRLTCGSYVAPHYSAATRCMVIWGANPTESDPVMADSIYATRGREAKLLVVDPRATRLAKKADIHAQLRPGTDGALALGMLNVIIAEKLYDENFVRDWTVGFDQLAKHVKDYTPERVEKITWIKPEVIREMARTYATNKPASIALGISMDHSTGGIQAIRAITTLAAITGNLDIPGGNVMTPPLRLKSLRLTDQFPESVPAGADYPLFTKYTLEQSQTPLIDQMVTQKPYPIKAMLVFGCNPALTWPNSAKFIKGRDQLDLLAVVDLFMTDTAKMADIVLPGTCYYERQDLRSYAGRGLPLITLTNQVVKPAGDIMAESMVLAGLGKRLGYAEYFPWTDVDSLFEYLFQDTDISLDRLRQNPGGVYYAGREFQKYLSRGFDTPSKKVELYSQLMAQHGYDPLPTYHEPAESPVSRPDLADKYPLTFVSGNRTVAFLHSQCRNLPSLRRRVPEPLLSINPQTANALGVADGDMVTVESPRGKLKVKAKVSDEVNPKVVAMQHGWSESNANCLTDDEARDPVSGYPGFRSVLCRVVKMGS